MGFFDDVKNAASNVVQAAVQSASNRTVEVSFADIPQSMEAFKALSQAQMSNPFDTAALTVVALCLYPADKALSLQMYEYLKGPAGVTPMEKQFINDRFMDKDYVPRSYFNGATPENDYKPSEPYTIKVSENPYSYNDQGYAKLYLASGGADSPRAVQLRQAKDGKWYLWEQFILADVRKPESSNPWA